MKRMSIEDIFGEDVEAFETLNDIKYDSYEGVTNVENEIDYNSGWYNYYTLSFDFEGKSYEVKYKEHVSDNVDDLDFIDGTLVCLGDADETDTPITMGDLVRMDVEHKKQLAEKDKTLKEYEDLFAILKPISDTNQLYETGSILTSAGLHFELDEVRMKKLETVVEFLHAMAEK